MTHELRSKSTLPHEKTGKNHGEKNILLPEYVKRGK